MIEIVETENGSPVGRCALWIDREARRGIIGNYSAATGEVGARVLDRACEALAAAGCTTAVGPMDGNTWRRYRFVVERGAESPFFLEPDNPDAWPGHWTEAGFQPCATYTSALNEDLAVEDPRTGPALTNLEASGISIRTIDLARADVEMHRIFRLSTTAFRGNPFYAPIAEEEFRAQMAGLMPYARPDLILLAERGDDLVGFMFAVPDVLRPAPDTVVLKTVAVDDSVRGLGLGGVLIDLAQRAARRLGFRRAIHALMHDANASRRISARYARPIRRYALFERPLATATP